MSDSTGILNILIGSVISIAGGIITYTNFFYSRRKDRFRSLSEAFNYLSCDKHREAHRVVYYCTQNGAKRKGCDVVTSSKIILGFDESSETISPEREEARTKRNRSRRKLQAERNNNSNNNGNGNANGKAKGKSKSKLQQHQEQEQKRRYTAYKYSQNSKSLLHEAVILAGRPALSIICMYY